MICIWNVFQSNLLTYRVKLSQPDKVLNMYYKYVVEIEIKIKK